MRHDHSAIVKLLQLVMQKGYISTKQSKFHTKLIKHSIGKEYIHNIFTIAIFYPYPNFYLL